MTFARTRDFSEVARVLAHPTQYRMASDDATPPARDFRPNEDERIVYVAVRGECNEVLGIFTLIPQNAVCYEIHAALLPAAWGSTEGNRRRAALSPDKSGDAATPMASSREALRGAVAWAWKETPARRIVAAVPHYNRLALKLAFESGFIAYGRNRAAFLRAGTLHDLVLLGVSRP